MENSKDWPWPNFLRVEVLSLIIALFFQAGALIWWGSKLDSRVTALEAKVTAASHLSEDVARIDERTKSIQDALTRIERGVDDKRGVTQ